MECVNIDEKSDLDLRNIYTVECGVLFVDSEIWSIIVLVNNMVVDSKIDLCSSGRYLHN